MKRNYSRNKRFYIHSQFIHFLGGLQFVLYNLDLQLCGRSKGSMCSFTLVRRRSRLLSDQMMKKTCSDMEMSCIVGISALAQVDKNIDKPVVDLLLIQ